MKLSEWLRESNRVKHFVGGFILGVLLTVLCALGAAGAMEYKDRAWGGQCDWVDFTLTLMGGMMGQIVQIIMIYVLFHPHIMEL